MELLPSALIRKKRAGQAHSREEIGFLVQEYATGALPDYQMSAWLMAVCFRGMTDEETFFLTEEMRDSGEVLSLGHLGVTVDKHSTGGIGDKTSLILAPLVAAAGLRVPMMAGRGLGHTGGTLDKLESIPGFDVRLSLSAFEKVVASCGAAIIGQTASICPADRKLYALRDVTGTVDSLPLICGSIMSKKLAEGMSALVLDVKFGSGAFMKTAEDGERLARALMGIGRRAGKNVCALLTRMDEPLGRMVGNALEVRECLDILDGKTCAAEGKGWDDTRELTLVLAGHMLHVGGRVASAAEGHALAEKHLRDGSARHTFNQMCELQGAHLGNELPRAPHVTPLVAERDGFFTYTDLEKIGYAGVFLGAGRKFQTDVLDLATGIECLRVQGEPVKRGDTLFLVHHAQDPRAALTALREGFSIEPQPTERSPLVLKVLT